MSVAPPAPPSGMYAFKGTMTTKPVSHVRIFGKEGSHDILVQQQHEGVKQAGMTLQLPIIDVSSSLNEVVSAMTEHDARAIGYGYNPLGAFWEVLGLSALGWIIYRRGYLAGNIVPTNKDAYETFKSDGEPPSCHSPFSPLIYSIEDSLPLVKFGQGDKWQPDTDPENKNYRGGNRLPRLGHLSPWLRIGWLKRVLIFARLNSGCNASAASSGANRRGTSARFLRWFSWIQILLGWLLATLFLAGITGIVRKNRTFLEEVN